MGLALTSCDSYKTLRTYEAPEGATLVDATQVSLALEEAENNFSSVSSMSTSFEYYYDNSILYSDALEPYASSVLETQQIEATLYANDVFKVRTTSTKESTLNIIYTSSTESNDYLLIEEYEMYDTTLYRIIAYSSSTTNGISSAEAYSYGMTDCYDVLAETYYSSIESSLLNFSDVGSLLSSVDYFNLSNSTRFTTDGSSLYYTYYSVSRSSMTNPLYPSDETKIISQYSVYNYQLIYSLINGFYCLTAVNALSATYITNDFKGKEFSKPYVISSTRTETTFTYDSRPIFTEELDFNLE